MMNKSKLIKIALADEKYVEALIPRGTSKETQEKLLDVINYTIQDKQESPEIPELLLSILEEGKGEIGLLGSERDLVNFFKMAQLISYLKFMKEVDAYESVYPDRAEKLRERYITDKEYKKAVNKAIDSIKRSNTKYKMIEQKLLIPSYLLYSGLRDEAMETSKKIMSGEGNPVKIYMYKKDEKGKYEKDEYGRRIPLLDLYGNHVFEYEYTIAGPKLQLDAAKFILDATELPKEISVDVTTNAMSKEEENLAKEAVKTLADIAKAQREALLKGEASLDDVQQIGRFMENNETIDVKPIEDSNEEEL